MFNKETIGKMKKGSWLVNNARGAICDPPAVVQALKSGHLRGLPHTCSASFPCTQSKNHRQPQQSSRGSSVMPSHCRRRASFSSAAVQVLLERQA